MVVQEDDCNLLVSGHSKKRCRQAAEADDRASALAVGGARRRLSPLLTLGEYINLQKADGQMGIQLSQLNRMNLKANI